MFRRSEVQTTILVAMLVAMGALFTCLASEAQTAQVEGQKQTNGAARNARQVVSFRTLESSGKHSMGDSIGLETALNSQDDLITAAGEHKKYMLVKKKPKHKKIKMEVFKPKMKYKKIKMKVPVKKMKKKKVKGYLVKKEHHH